MVDSLILYKNKSIIFRSDKSGLRPLIECILQNKATGCSLFDKVVGLASAKLIVFSNMIYSVETKICSKLAYEYLAKHNISVNCHKISENILNNDKSGICPMEKMAGQMSEGEFFEFMKEKIINAKIN